MERVVFLVLIIILIYSIIVVYKYYEESRLSSNVANTLSDLDIEPLSINSLTNDFVQVKADLHDTMKKIESQVEITKMNKDMLVKQTETLLALIEEMKKSSILDENDLDIVSNTITANDPPHVVSEAEG